MTMTNQKSKAKVGGKCPFTEHTEAFTKGMNFFLRIPSCVAEQLGKAIQER